MLLPLVRDGLPARHPSEAPLLCCRVVVHLGVRVILGVRFRLGPSQRGRRSGRGLRRLCEDGARRSKCQESPASSCGRWEGRRRRARGKTNLCGLPRARQRRRGQICLRLGLLATRHGLTPPEPDLHDCPAPARTPGPLEEDQVDHSTPFGFCLVCGFKPSKEELVFVVYGGFCGVYTRNVPRGLEDGEGHVLG